MKRKILFLIGSIYSTFSFAQEFSGQYTAEWQWDMNKNTNWANLMRLDMNIPIGKGNDAFEAATIHVSKTNDQIIDDWQAFSNLDADNMFAAIAVLGYKHEWNSGRFFVGVRTVNEDFFTSDITSLFLNSSCGIFPTIGASYPIANYPVSGLTLYFEVEKNGWRFKNSIYNGVGYNGWTCHDNPFLIKPKEDGVFNMSQLEYSCRGGQYFAGISIHSRQFSVDEEGGIDPSASCNRATCAWWLYAEQPLWTANDKAVTAMMQYSQNTSHSSACDRYAGIACAYTNSQNECGLSGQYARFHQGEEYSVELTWKRQLTKSIAMQPSLQYITNDNGDFTALCARLYYNF